MLKKLINLRQALESFKVSDSCKNTGQSDLSFIQGFFKLSGLCVTTFKRMTLSIGGRPSGEMQTKVWV